MTNENMRNTQYHRTYSSFPSNGWWTTEPRIVLNLIWMMCRAVRVHIRTKRLSILWWPNAERMYSYSLYLSLRRLLLLLIIIIMLCANIVCAAFCIHTVQCSVFTPRDLSFTCHHSTSFNWKILRRNRFWHLPIACRRRFRRRLVVIFIVMVVVVRKHSVMTFNWLETDWNSFRK